MKQYAHQRFESKLSVDPVTGCTVWAGAKKNNGSGLFLLSTWKPRKATSAQRFAYQFYVGPIPDNCCVKARCGNMLCVTPNHLKVKTRSDVIHESIKAGRWSQLECHNLPPVKTGSENPNARYSDDFVETIRRERANGTKLIVIATRHKIPVSTAGFCSKRKG